MADENEILRVNDLSVIYKTDLETVYAVNHVSFTLNKGETLGLVGETGAGKTTTALGIMGLLPKRTARITGGEIYYHGKNLLEMSEKELLGVRGQKISMIFQDPMTALNPVLTVDDQIGEAVRLHNTGNLSREEIEKKVDETLELVGIPKERKREYPYQFSGGMRQRVVIAMALICDPEMLIADEPTTALDVTIQAQVLSMICDLQRRLGTSMIMITHDLGVVAETCDMVAVVYAGEVVEYGKLADLFTGEDHHPYTEGLFGSIPDLKKKTRRLQPIEGLMPDPTHLPEGCKFAPRCRYATQKCRKEQPPLWEQNGHQIRCHLAGIRKGSRLTDANADRNEILQSEAGSPEMTDTHPAAAASSGSTDRSDATALPAGRVPSSEGTLMRVKNLKKYFKTKGGSLHAVDDVSFDIPRGKTLGVVGESGCGKSTLGRTILRLNEPTDGEILFHGTDLVKAGRRSLRQLRPKMQMIFQDPYSSLNGRMTTAQLIAEPLIVNKICSSRDEIDDRVDQIMETVGLAKRLIMAYPHELDGGRRQRIGVARALVLNPEFVVCDEPVSALDVSIQAQILNLLMDLQEQMGLTYLFITHNLSVVRHISDRIMVMYLGKCVEEADADEIFEHPVHPYTKALLAAIPIPDVTSQHVRRKLLQGEVTSPVNPKPGCRFAARCPYADEHCRQGDIPLKEVSPGHLAACLKAQ